LGGVFLLPGNPGRGKNNKLISGSIIAQKFINHENFPTGNKKKDPGALTEREIGSPAVSAPWRGGKNA